MLKTPHTHNQSLSTLQELSMYQFSEVKSFLVKSKMAAGGHFVRSWEVQRPVNSRQYLSNKKKFTKFGQLLLEILTKYSSFTVRPSSRI